MNPGWWIVPAVVTVSVVMLLAWYWWDMNRATGGFYRPLDAFIGLALTAVGALLVAIAWLTWAVFT